MGAAKPKALGSPLSTHASPPRIGSRATISRQITRSWGCDGKGDGRQGGWAVRGFRFQRAGGDGHKLGSFQVCKASNSSDSAAHALQFTTTGGAEESGSSAVGFSFMD